MPTKTTTQTGPLLPPVWTTQVWRFDGELNTPADVLAQEEISRLEQSVSSFVAAFKAADNVVGVDVDRQKGQVSTTLPVVRIATKEGYINRIDHGTGPSFNRPVRSPAQERRKVGEAKALLNFDPSTGEVSSFSVSDEAGKVQLRGEFVDGQLTAYQSRRPLDNGSIERTLHRHEGYSELEETRTKPAPPPSRTTQVWRFDGEIKTDKDAEAQRVTSAAEKTLNQYIAAFKAADNQEGVDVDPREGWIATTLPLIQRNTTEGKLTEARRGGIDGIFNRPNLKGVSVVGKAGALLNFDPSTGDGSFVVSDGEGNFEVRVEFRNDQVTNGQTRRPLGNGYIETSYRKGDGYVEYEETRNTRTVEEPER